jgi:hypothetical protein
MDSSNDLEKSLLRGSDEKEPFRYTDPTNGTVYTIPNDFGELVSRDKYVLQESDAAHVREFKLEVLRLLSQLAGYRAQLIAHEKTRRRMSFDLIYVAVAHWVFVAVMCIAVFGGYVNGKPWSVAFCVMLVELALLLVALSVKILRIIQHDRRSLPQNISLKLNFEKMPAVKARLGEQEFKDFVEPLQKALDEMCATLV